MSSDSKTTDLNTILTTRRIWREDLIIQLDAALRSADKGYYASARAELRGAILILDSMEKRDGR